MNNDVKKSFVIFLFFIIFGKITYSQYSFPENIIKGTGSQLNWIWQNPYPQGNDLHSVKFIGSKGWSAGNYGTILRTSNNGQNWNNQMSYTNQKLNSIYCMDEFNVWAVGNNGTILNTSNSGFNWNQINTTSNEDLYSVFFINSLTGWTVGSSNTILQTSDGGLNWISQQTGINNSILYSVMFINADTGWITGSYNSILNTTNGGDNWTTQQISTVELPLYSIKLNNGTLYAAGVGFYKSTDFGNTWINFPLNAWSPIISFDFVNSDTAFGIGGLDSFIRTTNAGLNWNYYPIQTNGLKNSICFQGASGHLVGENGIIYSSSNGGGNWFSQSSNVFYSFYSVCFPNSNTGWAVGSLNPGSNTGALMKTTDGGNNWIDRSDSSSTSFYDIYFLDENTGWTCGYKEKILKTTDGGNNWFLQYLSIDRRLTAIYFYDHNTGWAAGTGKVLRTTDGGNNWTRHTGFSEMFSMSFTNQNTGWVVGYGGRAQKTTNSGLNWTIIPIGTSASLNSVFFISQSTGWIAGSNLTLLKTTDGGENWINQSFGLPFCNIMSISFANENEGYAVGFENNSGVVFHTTNGGMIWKYSDNGPSTSLFSVHYNLSSGLFYTVGEFGSILRSEDSVITDFQENNFLSVPEGFYLSQNYPNPFNPKTIINYQLSMFNFVSIKVYDVLGNEVASLVNGKQNAGYYSVEFDGSGFASGVYFYKLEAGEFSETKRMVILK